MTATATSLLRAMLPLTSITGTASQLVRLFYPTGSIQKDTRVYKQLQKPVTEGLTKLLEAAAQQAQVQLFTQTFFFAFKYPGLSSFGEADLSLVLSPRSAASGINPFLWRPPCFRDCVCCV